MPFSLMLVYFLLTKALLLIIRFLNELVIFTFPSSSFIFILIILPHFFFLFRVFLFIKQNFFNFIVRFKFIIKNYYFNFILLKY